MQEEEGGDFQAGSSTNRNRRISSGRSIRRSIYKGVRLTLERTGRASFLRHCKISSNILSEKDSKYSCFNVGGRLRYKFNKNRYCVLAKVYKVLNRRS